VASKRWKAALAMFGCCGVSETNIASGAGNYLQYRWTGRLALWNELVPYLRIVNNKALFLWMFRWWRGSGHGESRKNGMASLSNNAQ